MWSLIFNRCDPLSGRAYDARPAAPATLDEGAFCAVHPKFSCATYPKCYWSSLTNRCERLRIGGGLFSGAQPSAPSCVGKTLLECLSAANCRWSSKRKLCFGAQQAPPNNR